MLLPGVKARSRFESLEHQLPCPFISPADHALKQREKGRVIIYLKAPARKAAFYKHYLIQGLLFPKLSRPLVGRMGLGDKRSHINIETHSGLCPHLF